MFSLLIVELGHVTAEVSLLTILNNPPEVWWAVYHLLLDSILGKEATFLNTQERQSYIHNLID